MRSSQIREWAGQQSQAKLKKVDIRLDKMVSVQFRKGSRSLLHDIPWPGYLSAYTELDFLMKKATLMLPQTNRDACVDNTKKEDIIKQTVPPGALAGDNYHEKNGLSPSVHPSV